MISITFKNVTLCSFSAVYTHTRLMALCPGLPGWAGTRKVKQIWILLKQETVSGSGISWVCASLHLAPDRQPRQHPTTQFNRPKIEGHWSIVKFHFIHTFLEILCVKVHFFSSLNWKTVFAWCLWSTCDDHKSLFTFRQSVYSVVFLPLSFLIQVL